MHDASSSPSPTQALIEEVTKLSAERDRLLGESSDQRRDHREQREALVSELAAQRSELVSELAAQRSEWDLWVQEQRAEWERQQQADMEALHKLRTEAQVRPCESHHAARGAFLQG